MGARHLLTQGKQAWTLVRDRAEAADATTRALGSVETFLSGLQTARGGTWLVFYASTGEKHSMTTAKHIGAQAARLLTGSAWIGKRVIEPGSMVGPDELAVQLGVVLQSHSHRRRGVAE